MAGPKEGHGHRQKKKKNFTSQSIWQKIERMTLLFRFDAYNSHILVNKKERERETGRERERASLRNDQQPPGSIPPPPPTVSAPLMGQFLLYTQFYFVRLFLFLKTQMIITDGGASHRRIKWHEYFRPSADFWIRLLFHRFSSKEQQKCVEFLGCS